jgi:hypothetical protein
MKSIRVLVTIANDRIRLAPSHAGNVADDDEGILAIRKRLTALYAGDASLARRYAQPNRIDAVLQLSYRPTPSVEAGAASGNGLSGCIGDGAHCYSRAT